MTTDNGGAPADGGGEVIDTSAENGAEGAPEGAGAGEGGEGGGREPLTLEQYQERDRQKTEALRRERMQSRQFRSELESLRRQMEAGSSTRGERQRVEEQIEEIPDPETNPMEALKALHKLAGNLTQSQRQDAEQGEKQKAEARFIQDLQSFVGESEKDFILDQPDYYDAVNHLKQDLKAEFEAQGFRGDGLTVAVNRELMRLAHTAKKNQSDPAEVYWKLAVRRGYKAKAAEREIDTIKKGQESSPNVPRGGARNNNFSRQALLEATGDDFDKQWKIYERQATGNR